MVAVSLKKKKKNVFFFFLFFFLFFFFKQKTAYEISLGLVGSEMCIRDRYLELRGGWAARDYMSGMRNYSGKKTMQIISKFREIDAKSKGINNPNTSTGDLMKELIFFILH